MKFTTILPATLLLLGACSSTEVLKEGALEQTKQISFNTHVNKSTRAAETLTIGNLTEFHVFGMYKLPDLVTPIRLFDGTRVYKEENAWKYNETKYWSEGATYNFFAYSNQNKELSDPVRPNLSADNDGKVQFNIVDYKDDTHQNDLIFAKKTVTGAKDGENKEVSLEFGHILSRVCIEFENQYADDFELTISNVIIYSVRNQGKFYGADNKWGVGEEVNRVPSDSHPEVAFNFANDAQNATLAKTGDKATTDFRYVIPYQYGSANVSIKFTIALQKDGKKSEKRLAGKWTPLWEMGKSYKYKIAISGGTTGSDPIVFGVASVGSSAEGNENGWLPGTTTIDGMTFTAD